MILTPNQDDLRRQWKVSPSPWRDEKRFRDYCERKRSQERKLARMAISLVVSTKAALIPSNTGDSPAVDTSGATLLVLVISYYSTAPTISDSKSNTWTPLTAWGNAEPSYSRIYYCASPIVGSGHTFKASGPTSYMSIAVLAFSGTASSPLDTENGIGGFGYLTSLATGSVSPSESDEVVIAGLEGYADSPSIDSGFTLQEHTPLDGANYYGVAAAYKIQTSAGAENPTWSWTTNYYAAASIASFKAAAAAGGSRLIQNAIIAGMRSF